MEMMEAMRKCELGGYVSRGAYPNRKYYKSCCGLFYEAVKVDHIDFIATDWEHIFPKVDSKDVQS